jgi:ABC-type glycerol-3-phosphate transport system substrate-binding protein
VKMTRLHQWAIIVIVTIVALFGMSSSSTASETKDITIWAYDNWAKAAEKAVEIYQNNNPNSGYIFHVVAMTDRNCHFGFFAVSGQNSVFPPNYDCFRTPNN